MKGGIMKKFIIVFLALILLFIIFLSYNGLFTKIIVEEKNLGPYNVVYGNHIGDYSQIFKVQMVIYDFLLNEHKIKTERGIGIFYDNPKKVKNDLLKSEAGCILEEKDFKKIPEIQLKHKTKIILKNKYVIAEFPIKNTLSFFLGAMKVYPVLNEYISMKKYKETYAIEIYDMTAKKIIFAFPIINN